MSSLIITVAVVCDWRGVWHLMDLWGVPPSLSVFIGLLTFLVHFFVSNDVKSRILDQSSWQQSVVFVCYTHFLLFGGTNMWRGIWHGFDDFFAAMEISEAWNVSICLIIGSTLLVASRSFQNNIACPFVIASDQTLIPKPTCEGTKFDPNSA